MRRHAELRSTCRSALARSCWNSISLPARRTHSPVEVSRAPRIPNRTPACLEDARERRRDLLGARIERLRRADIEQIIEGSRLLGVCTIGTSEPFAQSPRVSAGSPTGCSALRRRRRRSSARAEKHLRPSRGAGASDKTSAGARARSDTPPRNSRRWCTPTASLRRSRREPARAARRLPSMIAPRSASKCCFRSVVHPLERQRLAGQKRRARVLAASAFGAGERIEPILPARGRARSHADAHVPCRRFHDLLEIERRDTSWRVHRGGKTAPAAPSRCENARRAAGSPGSENTISICSQ